MPTMQSPPGAYTVIDGRRYLYFAGTGYLGLQGHPEVIRAACDALQTYGIGAATSRSGLGNSPPVVEAEREAARFFGADDAFYFGSGYLGNHALATLLGHHADAVFVDCRSHYCVMEAARLVGKPVHEFEHLNPQSLHDTLRAQLAPRQVPLVLSDGVFSVRGTVTPVNEYRNVLAEYPGAMLCLDDAHGMGVLGQCGRGTYEQAGCSGSETNHSPTGCQLPDDTGSGQAPQGPNLFFCGTLSKALGAYGGVIPGSRGFVQLLKEQTPYYAGLNPPPAAMAAAATRAMALVRQQPELLETLRRNTSLLRDGLRALGLDVEQSPTPIVCLELDSAEQMRHIQTELAAREIMIAFFATYAGLGPQGALRIAVFATHTETMIAQLIEQLAALL